MGSGWRRCWPAWASASCCSARSAGPRSAAARASRAANAADGGNVQAIAHLIFTQYVWAFEVTSALLITAAVGAMVLAHREPVFHRPTQRELSEQRTLAGAPQPLTAPGVYARHNAVDTPGLLPDGSPSTVSVPASLGEIRPPSGAGVHRPPEIPATDGGDREGGGV